MKQQENLRLGICWILFSAFGFAVMGLCVRLAGEIPFVQKTLFRNMIAFFIAFSTLCAKAKNDRSVLAVPRDAWKFLILRSAVGSLGIFGNFYALGHMNISDAAMLNKMSPFFAVAASIFVLKEKPGTVSIVSLLIVFSGSLFVIKPSFDFEKVFPAIFAFVGGMGAGLASCFVRKLHLYNVCADFIIAFFSLFSILIALPFVFFCYTPMSFSQVMILLGAGIGAACGQFGMTNAYFNAPAAKISVYDYSNVLFAGILGFIFLGQIPDAFSIAGYIIIIGTAFFVFAYNCRKLEK
ncbi:DMT family transporter [Treponema sp.]|uniref:DMT family transporter n=1 Tax=Treponema sp. TaxID=166 RepID=UPI003F04BFF1